MVMTTVMSMVMIAIVMLIVTRKTCELGCVFMFKCVIHSPSGQEQTWYEHTQRAFFTS